VGIEKGETVSTPLAEVVARKKQLDLGLLKLDRVLSR
jgi:hypothetical protein